MIRLAFTLAFLLLTIFVCASDERPSANPSFEYEVVRTHELKPHRRTIPLDGVQPGFNQLHLTLTVSQAGDVIDVDANGDKDAMKFWPQVEGEVRHWKFTPFEQNGIPVTAQIEEYIDLVPPERLPKTHIAPPPIRQDSKISISLERTGCYGTCPSYTVTITCEGITFEGSSYVAARGKHLTQVDASAVRKLAARFEATDFYSMESRYVASVTDNPTYVLTISIDGHEKKVVDYVGEWEGMPVAITNLEDEVDSFADTKRWIEGGSGLVPALQAEKFNFQSFEAQLILKEAATRGQTETVQGLLAAGVPLYPVPGPKPKEPYIAVPFDHVGLLTSSGGHFQTLQLLIDAGAGRNDQSDKDLALVNAARSGDVESVRALIAYGANPNADLGKATVVEEGGGGTLEGPGAGSVLIYAAESGNPEMVKEILRYHPNLEARDQEGKTAIFAAGDSHNDDKEGARVACVQLLAEAGANVNARDKDGNTPLHETFLTDVEQELLKLGADVNARNKDGETPIFTTVDDQAIPLLIEHGADLNIRNNKGETVVEAAKERGPARMEALRKALQSLVQNQK